MSESYQQPAPQAISSLANQIRREIDAFSAGSGLTGAQGRVLHFLLAQTRDIYQKDVEEEFSLRAPTASDLLTRMEADGLITRVPDEKDRRRKKILLTQKALQYQGRVIEDLQTLETKLTKDIRSEDLEVFFAVVRQMQDNLNTQK